RRQQNTKLRVGKQALWAKKLIKRRVECRRCLSPVKPPPPVWGSQALDNAEGLPTRARPTINSVAKFGSTGSAIVAQKVSRPEYLEPNTDHRVGAVIVAVIVSPLVVRGIVRPVGRCDDHCRWGRNFGDDRRANHWRAGCV